MESFLIIRRVGMDCQARGTKVRIIHHRETLYRASLVIVVQSTQDWQGEDLASRVIPKNRLPKPFWNLLPDTLMRSGLIEVLDIGTQDTMQLLLLQDEQVIQTLTSHTAEEAFTDGIGSRSVVRRFQDLDAAGCGHAREIGSKLVITIPDQILRSNPKSGGFPQLLCRPRVSGRACHAHVDHFARVQVDDEEGEQRAEEQVSHPEKVASPDLLGMSVNERPPRLSMWSCGAHSSHVLLNGAFRNVNAQLEEFASDAFCSPQSVVPCHLPNQGDGLLGDPWLERSCPGLVSPKELETLTMPA
jgi:hypothetical protein